MMPFVKKLNEIGFTVDPVSTVEEAMILAGNKEYDLIVADIRMDPIDGIVFLQKVDSLQPSAGRVVLTSYSYFKKYKERIRALDFVPGLIEKPLPNFEDIKFIDRVVRPLKENAITGRQSEIADVETRVGHTVDPFGISFDDFMDLTIEQKDCFTDIAIAEAKETVMAEFRKGKVWVLLCGSKNQIRKSVDNIKDIPQEEKILKFAQDLDYAPYQVSKSVTTEDMNTWCSCENTENQRNDYPTVTLRINSNEITSHFDTGAPVSFFSYEDLVSISGINPSSTFIPAIKEDSSDVYRFTQMNFRCKLVCQDNSQTRSIKLVGQAVRDWHGSPFNRSCEDVCKHKVITCGNGEICKYRHALIGRSILSDNKIQIILDGHDNKTKLIKIKK